MTFRIKDLPPDQRPVIGMTREEIIQGHEQAEMACMALQAQIDNLHEAVAALKHRIVLIIIAMGLGTLWLMFS